MFYISMDLLLNLSTIMTFTLLFAKFGVFTFIHFLALRYLTANKSRLDEQSCQDSNEMPASEMGAGASALLSDATTESVNRLMRFACFQAPEPMTPSTDDGADFPPFEQSSDGSSSEPDLDLRDMQNRPRALSTPAESDRCARNALDPDMSDIRNRSRTVSLFTQSHPLERRVNSIFNKLTRERFDSLYQQLLNICSGEDFNQDVTNLVARGVYAKAIVQHTFVDMYAEACSKLYCDFATQATRTGVADEFKRRLLEQCQNSFNVYLQAPPVDASLDEEEQFEQLIKHKTKMLGNVRLIAHLIRQRILSPKMIFHCTDELLKVGSAETLESLCMLVSTLGDFFNAPEWHAHVQLLILFSRIRTLSEDTTQSSRIRFLMKNVLDERNVIRSGRLASPPPAPKEMKPLPVLLGRTGSVRGGVHEPMSEEIQFRKEEQTKQGLAKQIEHSCVEIQKSNEKENQYDTKLGQELSLSVALQSERTALRAAASPFQPANSNQEVAVVTEAPPKTSIMLRNIPADVSRSEVLDVLRTEGFADQITFVYVPMNLRSKGNFGYAFVDFDSFKTAERCKEQLEGFTRWAEASTKALEVAWSDTQGLDAQIARYRDSPLMHESVADEMKPALYNNGTRVVFPAPTKNLRAPRLRKIVEPVEQHTP